jgi:DNA-binding response OmpR family regulator
MVLSAVWGTGYGREARYLHAYVHRLRQKLGEGSGIVIRTLPGVGYSLDPTVTPGPAATPARMPVPAVEDL